MCIDKSHQNYTGKTSYIGTDAETNDKIDYTPFLKATACYFIPEKLMAPRPFNLVKTRNSQGRSHEIIIVLV